MNCTKAQDLFSGVLENTVSPSLGTAFEAHLAECPKCNATYSKFATAILMVEGTPEVEVPEGLHAAIMARVEQARRTVPHKVKWWTVDWSKAFTVRVPARAAAMGLALLLGVAVVVRLAPQHTTTAGMVPGSQPSTEMSQEIDANAIRPWGPWGTALAQRDSGLLISVAAHQSNRRNVYALRFRTNNAQRVDFQVYLVSSTNWESASRAAGSPYSANSVVRGRDSVVSVAGPTESGAVKAAKVVWSNEGQKFMEYVFLPARFDTKAADKSMNIAFQNTTAYGLLRKVSAKYGVAIMASGYLGKQIASMKVDGGSPADVFYSLSLQTQLRTRPVAASVYALEQQD